MKRLFAKKTKKKKKNGWRRREFVNVYTRRHVKDFLLTILLQVSSCPSLLHCSSSALSFLLYYFVSFSSSFSSLSSSKTSLAYYCCQKCMSSLVFCYCRRDWLSVKKLIKSKRRQEKTREARNKEPLEIPNFSSTPEKENVAQETLQRLDPRACIKKKVKEGSLSKKNAATKTSHSQGSYDSLMTAETTSQGKTERTSINEQVMKVQEMKKSSPFTKKKEKYA